MSSLHSYQRTSWGKRIGIVVASLVALAVAGYVGSVVGPHFKATSAATTTTTSTRPPSTTTSTVAHASVKVLVANSTQEPNTAGHFAQQLQLQGWNVAAPTNTTAPATTTAIYYAPNQQAAATEIASELGALATAVQAVSPAAPVTSTTGIDVVVVIGSDLAGSGFPAMTAPTGLAPTTTASTT